MKQNKTKVVVLDLEEFNAFMKIVDNAVKILKKRRSTANVEEN